jgi:hypothetical protein
LRRALVLLFKSAVWIAAICPKHIDLVVKQVRHSDSSAVAIEADVRVTTTIIRAIAPVCSEPRRKTRGSSNAIATNAEFHSKVILANSAYELSGRVCDCKSENLSRMRNDPIKNYENQSSEL